MFSFGSFINGIQNEYLTNVGTFDAYENGTQISRSSYLIWKNSTAGTVYECNNFKIESKFKYIGVHGGKLPDGVTINTDRSLVFDSDKPNQSVKTIGTLNNINVQI